MTEQYKPEIGEYCEVFLPSNVLGDRWAKVKCVGHGVRKYEDPYVSFSKELKTLFDSDSRIYHNLNTSDYQAVIKLLWDNGYRKVE